MLEPCKSAHDPWKTTESPLLPAKNGAEKAKETPAVRRNPPQRQYAEASVRLSGHRSYCTARRDRGFPLRASPAGRSGQHACAPRDSVRSCSPFAQLGLPTPGSFFAPADGFVAVLHFIVPSLGGRTLRLFCAGGRSRFFRLCFCCLLGFRSRSFLGHCGNLLHPVFVRRRISPAGNCTLGRCNSCTFVSPETRSG